MTLEIPTELEAKLQRAAQARGTDAQTLLLETARRLVEGVPLEIEPQEERDAKRRRLALELRGSVSGDNSARNNAAETKRLAAVNRLHGCLAKSDFTVDDFLREHSEEGRKEAGL